jgi:hypothetical protein
VSLTRAYSIFWQLRNIWNLLHFDQDLIEILDSKTHQGMLDLCACISYFLNMSCTSILIPLYLLNILVNLNPNIKGAPPRHFLLQIKDNNIASIILSNKRSNYLICCSLSSYSNSLSRYPIQSKNRSSESRYS